MGFNFLVEEEAQRDQVWLRGFFMGPTGSGKSRGALEVASRIFDGSLDMTLVNTERGRGKLYADRYRFRYIDMSEGGDFSPEAYVAAIDIAERDNPGGVYVVDSASHEWAGAAGVLQLADKFGDWKQIRPRHNEFVERLMAVQAHVIVTVRAKMKYEVSEEEVPGRTKPRQTVVPLGIGPIQDGDLQYEFNCVARFDQATKDATFSGHVDQLDGMVANLAAERDAPLVAERLTEWLSSGNPIEPVAIADPEDVEALRESLRAEGLSEERIEGGLRSARSENRGHLHPDYVAVQFAKSRERLEAKAAAPNEDPVPA